MRTFDDEPASQDIVHGSLYGGCSVFWLVGIYIIVFLVALLIFWYGLGCFNTRNLNLLSCFLASVVALVILIVALPLIEAPGQHHRYGDIVIYQRPPLDENDQVVVRCLLAIAWFVPLVLLGWLILAYLSNPESRVGRVLTGLPEPCSTERTLSCPEGVEDPSLCRLKAKTTVCGRDTVTLVFDD